MSNSGVVDWQNPRFDGCPTAASLPAPTAFSTLEPVNGVLHEVQSVFERYGIPPDGGVYQPLTRTLDIWYDAPPSVNYREVVTITLESGETRLSHVNVNDGENWWFYDRITDATHAYETDAKYTQARGDADTMRQGLRGLMLRNLEQSNATDSEWCYLGQSELPEWGTTYLVARDWHCSPARGCPSGEWYSELYWMQPEIGRIPLRVELRNTPEGDQELIRRDEILRYEVIPGESVGSDHFRFAFPPDLPVVRRDDPPDPTNPAAEEPRTLSVEEFSEWALYTPILPTYVPEPYELSTIYPWASRNVTVTYVNPDDPIYRWSIDLWLPGSCIDNNYQPLPLVEKNGIRAVWMQEMRICAEFPAIPNAPTAMITTILLTQQEMEAVLESMRAIR